MSHKQNARWKWNELSMWSKVKEEEVVREAECWGSRKQQPGQRDHAGQVVLQVRVMDAEEKGVDKWGEYAEKKLLYRASREVFGGGCVALAALILPL